MYITGAGIDQSSLPTAAEVMETFPKFLDTKRLLLIKSAFLFST